jgi:putative ABC transport system substrate-binding protein
MPVKGTNRRAFMAGLTGAATWWKVARAQKQEGIRRLGVLYGLAEDDPNWRINRNAFIGEMRKLGWIEGVNLAIEYRTALGDEQRFREYAAELVSLKPDLILGVSPSALAALADQTRTIPIVFTVDNDPIREGHVTSLAHPGGNITGFTDVAFVIAGKWPQLLKEVLPSLSEVYVVYHPQLEFDEVYMKFIRTGASAVNVEVKPVLIGDVPEIKPVIASLAFAGRNGLLVIPSAFTAVHRTRIIEAITDRAVPAIFPYKYFAVSGGLMSYSVDQSDEFPRAARYVDRILKGANPGDLPIQEPIKFELVVNLKTAKAMDIVVPPSLLARADEVIE